MKTINRWIFLYYRNCFFLLLVVLVSCEQSKKNPAIVKIDFELNGLIFDNQGKTLLEKENLAIHEIDAEAYWLYFGFLQCPDMCPLTFSRLQQANQLLGHKKKKVRTLFISVDPKKDSLPQMKKRLLGYKLTGAVFRDDLSKIDRLLKQLYLRSTPDNPHAHSTRIFLLNGQGVLRDSFSLSSEPSEIASSSDALLGWF